MPSLVEYHSTSDGIDQSIQILVKINYPFFLYLKIVHQPPNLSIRSELFWSAPSLSLHRRASNWDQNKADIVIPWHLSLNHLRYNICCFSEAANVVLLVPPFESNIKLSFPLDRVSIYFRSEVVGEILFLHYLQTTSRFGILLWGDELPRDSIALQRLKLLSQSNSPIVRMVKYDYTFGACHRVSSATIRGGRYNEIELDTSNLHSLISVRNSAIGDPVVSLSILHFNYVGMHGALKASENAFNELYVLKNFSPSFFFRRFICSELLNLPLLVIRVSFIQIPLFACIKISSFFNALYLFLYQYYKEPSTTSALRCQYRKLTRST